MYRRNEIIEYLEKYGWNEYRSINTEKIMELYNQYFNSFNEDDYTTISFQPYLVFNKVLDFWKSFGELTISYPLILNIIGENGIRYKKEKVFNIIIDYSSILNCSMYQIIDCSIFFNKKLFPVALDTASQAFICIDEKGYFYMINDGCVHCFSDDFFQLVDTLINDKKFPKPVYVDEYD